MRVVRRWFKGLVYRREVSRLAGAKVLKALSSSHPDLQFVQVGANDGKMMDPIRSTILRTNWRGWVLEPVPDLFQSLKKNYACVGSRVVPVNVALSDSDGHADFYHLSADAGMPALPEWAAGLGSFRRDVIVSHSERLPDIERYIRHVQVPCVTWKTLCCDLDIQTVDLLVVDVEGYDYEVVRQLDYSDFRPFVVVYEHHHFDAATDADCTALLAGHGYSLFREGLDTWAIDVSNPDFRYRRLIRNLNRWVKSSPYAGSIGT